MIKGRISGGGDNPGLFGGGGHVITSVLLK